MRSKPGASRVVASTALVAALAGGGVLGQSFAVTAVAGAQTGNDQRPDGHGPNLDAAARALNLSADDLGSKLEDGNTTIAEVAQAKGVDVQKVIDAMVADATAHVDQAVKDGKLTADQASDRKSGLKDRITKLVNDGPPKDRGAGAPGDGGGPGGPPDSTST